MVDKVSERYLAEIGGATDEKMGLVDHLGHLKEGTLLEIGPGTGNALRYLIAQIREQLEPEQFPRIKVFDIFEDVLKRLESEIDVDDIRIDYVVGDGAEELPFASDSINGVNISSVIHECFSYGGGYRGINNIAEELGRVMALGGIMSYRDPEGVSLNNRVRTSLNSPVARLFLSFFLPKFLSREFTALPNKVDLGYTESLAIHLNGKDVTLDEIAATSPQAISSGQMTIDCQSGLAHEIQRHFVLFVKTLKANKKDPKLVNRELRKKHKIPFSALCDEDIELFKKVGAKIQGDHLVATSPQINLAWPHLTYQASPDAGAQPFLSETMEYMLEWSLSEGEEHYFYGSCEENIARFALFSLSEEPTSSLGRACLCPISLEHIRNIKRLKYTSLVDFHMQRDDSNGEKNGKFNVHFQKMPVERAIVILSEYYSETGHPAIAEVLRHFMEVLQDDFDERRFTTAKAPIGALAQKSLYRIEEALSNVETSGEAIDTYIPQETPQRIGLIGGVGVGKTTIASGLSSFGYTVVTLSEFIRMRLESEGIAVNSRRAYFEMGNKMREEGGNSILARLGHDKISESGFSKFIIDGIRTREEIELLRRNYTDILMVGIETPVESRLRRLANRARTLVDERTRTEVLRTMKRENSDASPHGCRLAEALTLADIFLSSDSTPEAIQDKINAALNLPKL